MHAGMYMRKQDAYAYIHTSSMYGVYVCIYIYIYVCVYIYTHRFARGVGRMHRERTIICILEHPLIHLFALAK